MAPNGQQEEIEEENGELNEEEEEPQVEKASASKKKALAKRTAALEDSTRDEEAYNLINQEDDDDDLLRVKRKNYEIDDSELQTQSKVSRNRLKKIKIDEGVLGGKNITYFDKKGSKLTTMSD